jgi:hypothetical protein
VYAGKVIKATKPRRYQGAPHLLPHQLRRPRDGGGRGRALLQNGQVQIPHHHGKCLLIKQKLANEKAKVMEVHIEDIEEMLRKEEDRNILNQLRTNTKRYVEILYEIVEKNIPQRNI